MTKHIEIDETSGDDFATPELLIAAMNKAIAKGFRALVKWTCPKCGKRCTSGEPNRFNTGGYYHDEPGCGHLYTGQRYGLALVGGSDPAKIDKLIADTYAEFPTFEGPLPGFRDD